MTANVTVTGVTQAGYLTGYPAGTTEPLTNFVSYVAGSTVTANPTFLLSAPSVNPQLTIKTHNSAAQVIIDVTGYYAPSISGVVNDDGTLGIHTSRVLSSTFRPLSISYVVTVDRDITNCVVSANDDYSYPGFVLVGTSGNQAFFKVRTDITTSTQARFHFNVIC